MRGTEGRKKAMKSTTGRRSSTQIPRTTNCGVRRRFSHQLTAFAPFLMPRKAAFHLPAWTHLNGAKQQEKIKHPACTEHKTHLFLNNKARASCRRTPHTPFFMPLKAECDYISCLFVQQGRRTAQNSFVTINNVSLLGVFHAFPALIITIIKKIIIAFV